MQMGKNVKNAKTIITIVIADNGLEYNVVIFMFQRLIEAVLREDLSEVILLLAHSDKKDVNEREEDDLIRTPLHISSSKGNVVLTLLLIWVRFYKCYSSGREINLEGIVAYMCIPVTKTNFEEIVTKIAMLCHRLLLLIL